MKSYLLRKAKRTYSDLNKVSSIFKKITNATSPNIVENSTTFLSSYPIRLCGSYWLVPSCVSRHNPYKCPNIHGPL